jgi:hypothetical protein
MDFFIFKDIFALIIQETSDILKLELKLFSRMITAEIHRYSVNNLSIKFAIKNANNK